MSDFSEIYLPARAEGEPDPSRRGFATEEEAWEYVSTQMCASCTEERRMALAGEKWEYEEDEEFQFQPSEFPGCACEWIVVPTKEEGYDSYEDLMEAGGWKLVYQALPEPPASEGEKE